MKGTPQPCLFSCDVWSGWLYPCTPQFWKSKLVNYCVYSFLLQAKFQTLMIPVCHMSARSMVFAGCLKMVTLCANASQTALSSMIPFVGQTERTTPVNVFWRHRLAKPIPWYTSLMALRSAVSWYLILLSWTSVVLCKIRNKDCVTHLVN